VRPGWRYTSGVNSYGAFKQRALQPGAVSAARTPPFQAIPCSRGRRAGVCRLTPSKHGASAPRQGAG